jgi:hypothetical protein
MCLSTIMNKQSFLKSAKDKIKYLNKTHYIGYKAVKRTRRNYLWASIVPGEKFEVGVPIVNNYFGYIVANSGDFYDRGFHTLCDLQDAIKYCLLHFPLESDKIIVKTYIPISSVTTYGKQDGCYVYVSNSITIPSQFPFSRHGKKLEYMV